MNLKGKIKLNGLKTKPANSLNTIQIFFFKAESYNEQTYTAREFDYRSKTNDNAEHNLSLVANTHVYPPLGLLFNIIRTCRSLKV